MIIVVGYKVNSERAIQFRKWAGQIVKDYTIQGWVMDVDSNITKTFFSSNSLYNGGNLIRSVTISDGIIDIEEGVFRGYSNLTSIKIPTSVTSIETGAFSECISLTIYCEAMSKPSEWSSSWNYYNRHVVCCYTENQ